MGPLLASLRDAGLTVEYGVTGEPRPLSREVDIAAFRILQEGLTNALKHGSGDTARAILAYAPSAVAITVENEVSATSAAVNGGHGLLGIRERAHLLGGRLTTGRDDGQWRLRVELPLREDVG